MSDPDRAPNDNMDYSYTVAPIQRNQTFGGWNNETYSMVGFELVLKRYFLKQFCLYYAPSMSVVLVSWISFLIPTRAIPGRMALLVTLLLVLINLYAAIVKTQPPTKAFTVLEIWMDVCLEFVWFALFAYAVLLFHQRYHNAQTPVTVMGSQTSDSSPTLTPMAQTSGNFLTDQDKYRAWDKRFLMFFPALFLLFNFIYWPVTLTR